MMDHNDCNQHGCWLISFADRLQASRPKFLIGDAVKTHFTDDTGAYRGCDYGLVVGMVWNRPGNQPGWWYFIQLYRIGSTAGLTAPHFEEIEEEALEPDS